MHWTSRCKKDVLIDRLYLDDEQKTLLGMITRHCGGYYTASLPKPLANVRSCLYGVHYKTADEARAAVEREIAQAQVAPLKLERISEIQKRLEKAVALPVELL